MEGISKAFGEIMVIASGIVGLAVVAVLVSKNADTANVIRSAGGALATGIGAAVSPVSGFGMNAGGGFSNQY